MHGPRVRSRELTDIEPLSNATNGLEIVRDTWFTTTHSRGLRRNEGESASRASHVRFPNSPRFELEDSRKGLLEIPFPYNLMDFTTFPLCSKTILVFVIYPSRIYANSPGYREFWFIHSREKYRGLILIIGNAVYKSHLLILEKYIYTYPLRSLVEKKKINYQPPRTIRSSK